MSTSLLHQVCLRAANVAFLLFFLLPNELYSSCDLLSKKSAGEVARYEYCKGMVYYFKNRNCDNIETESKRNFCLAIDSVVKGSSANGNYFIKGSVEALSKVFRSGNFDVNAYDRDDYHPNEAYGFTKALWALANGVDCKTLDYNSDYFCQAFREGNFHSKEEVINFFSPSFLGSLKSESLKNNLQQAMLKISSIQSLLGQFPANPERECLAGEVEIEKKIHDFISSQRPPKLGVVESVLGFAGTILWPWTNSRENSEEFDSFCSTINFIKNEFGINDPKLLYQMLLRFPPAKEESIKKLLKLYIEGGAKKESKCPDAEMAKLFSMIYALDTLSPKELSEIVMQAKFDQSKLDDLDMLQRVLKIKIGPEYTDLGNTLSKKLVHFLIDHPGDLSQGMLDEALSAIFPEVSVVTPLRVTMENIPKIAEEVGFKSANLTFLQKVVMECGQKEKSNLNFSVPPFASITSEQSKELLGLYHLNLDQEWNEIRGNYLKTKNRDLFYEQVEKLSRKIGDTFNGEINLALLPPAILEFLKHAQNKKLMVRSTGMEDTEKISNAGGNESFANVVPTGKEVLKYFGKVVASYFNPKSFKQLLSESGVKDDNLEAFLGAPKIPVLIQEMVGEQEGDLQKEDISVGMVVFSKDPSGFYNESTVINSTYGHNEGVVSSSVPSDQFMVFNYGNTSVGLDQVSKKRFRLRPEKGRSGTLTSVENSSDMIERPVLNQQEVARMNSFTRCIEEQYKKPMDMEIIYTPKQKTFHVVQARPIVEHLSKERPNYLDVASDTEGRPLMIKGRTFLDGGNFVRTIQTPEELLMNDQSLSEALTTYLNLTPQEKSKIKGVVLTKNASLLSHEATIFRGINVPVIVMSEEEKGKLLSSNHSELYLDPQRGVIVPKAGAKVIDGYLSAPIPLVNSFFPIDASLDAASSALIQPKAPTVPTAPSTVEALFAQLKSSSSEKSASKSLSTMLYLLHSKTKELEKFYGNNKGMQEKMVLLFQNFKELTNKMMRDHLFSLPSNHPLRLLFLRKLEALLFQERAEEIVGTYSFKNMFQLIELKKEVFEKYQFEDTSEEGHLLNSILMAHKNAIDETHFANWITFLNKNIKEHSSELSKTVGELISQEIFSPLLHLNFQEVPTLESLTRAYQDAKDTASKIKEMEQKTLLILKSKEDRWNDPKEFPKLLAEMETVARLLSDQALARLILNSKDKLSKLLWTNFLHEVVASFDASIKNLKASTLYPSEQEKVQNFQKMLLPFLSLLKGFRPFTEGKNFTSHEDRKAWYPTLDFDQWLGITNSILNNDRLASDPAQLQPSANFCVRTFSMGSDADYRSSVPLTLEDAFTTIHQSLESLISNQSSEALASTTVDSKAFAAYDKMVRDIRTPYSEYEYLVKSNSSALVAITIEDKKLQKRYNVSLRYHSAVFEITYQKSSVELDMHLLGIDGDRFGWRWISLDFYSHLFCISNKLKCDIDFNGQAFNLKIIMDRNDSDPLKLKEIQTLLENSLKRSMYTSNHRMSDASVNKLKEGFINARGNSIGREDLLHLFQGIKEKSDYAQDARELIKTLKVCDRPDNRPMIEALLKNKKLGSDILVELELCLEAISVADLKNKIKDEYQDHYFELPINALSEEDSLPDAGTLKMIEEILNHYERNKIPPYLIVPTLNESIVYVYYLKMGKIEKVKLNITDKESSLLLKKFIKRGLW
ncbi:MAG: hypothetical protein HQK52_15225 [Oligoflexia bacterium]|nr:hypothetical protein [Oligoflexia bacterium]